MLVVVTYDVKTETREGRKRLNRIAKICCDYGQRVQNSVFECDLDAAQLVKVRAKLLEILNEEEDSLRIYHLGNHYEKKIEHFGCKAVFDPEEPLFV